MSDREHIVGKRLVPEPVFFMYDRMEDPRCVHDISVYEACGKCSPASSGQKEPDG